MSHSDGNRDPCVPHKESVSWCWPSGIRQYTLISVITTQRMLSSTPIDHGRVLVDLLLSALLPTAEKRQLRKNDNKRGL